MNSAVRSTAANLRAAVNEESRSELVSNWLPYPAAMEQSGMATDTGRILGGSEAATDSGRSIHRQ